MSPSEALPEADPTPMPVRLRCDFPGAELVLVDGHLRLVAKGMQSLAATVPPGVYAARVRVAEALREELLVVRPGQPLHVELSPPLVASAMPLEGSATSHEYHQLYARTAALQEHPLHADGTASLFLLAREWRAPRREGADAGPPAAAQPWGCQDLQLMDAAGAVLHRFALPPASLPLGPDAAAGQAVQLRPGCYRLAASAGQDRVELVVHLAGGWQTQVYLLAQPGKPGAVFQDASVLWLPRGEPLDAARADLRVLESLRHAAESQRRRLTRLGLHRRLYQQHRNPMLALLSAHALHRRGAAPARALAGIADWVEDQLGPLPDVAALRLAIDPAAAVPPLALPPMLRASWELLLADRRHLPVPGSLADTVSRLAIGSGTWMTWLHGSAPEAALTGPPAAGAMPSPKPERVLFGAPVDTRPLSPPKLPEGAPRMQNADLNSYNERFVQRLLRRRPQDRARLEASVQEESVRLADLGALEGMATTAPAREQPWRTPRDFALETIVNQERPVLFVQGSNFNTSEVTILGTEAQDLVQQMRIHGGQLQPLLTLIGRIDVVNFPNNAPFLGTAWFIDTDIVVTNRHVAQHIARWDGRQFVFARGVGGQAIESSFCNAHEYDDLAPDASRVFPVTEVLYIEPDSSPHDIAFLRVRRRTDGRGPAFIPVAPADPAEDLPVCTIGYPARAPRRVIPDQELMRRLYLDRYDVKRAAPGYTSGMSAGSVTHDCTTLGGNSGSVVLDLRKGVAVGLHFAGLYQQDNFAVPASLLNDYIRRKRWNAPSIIETGAIIQPPSAVAPASAAPAAATPAGPSVPAAEPVTSITVTVPVTITVSVGAAVTQAGPGAPAPGVPSQPAVTLPAPAAPVAPPATVAAGPGADLQKVEQAAADYWAQRPAGVLATRVGFFENADGTIGDEPCIAVSVQPAALAQLELGGPHLFAGVPVRYLPAGIDDQAQALQTESVDQIAYDDDARRGERFSFAPLNEEMDLTLHVGPEYSWEVLQDFLANAQGRMVSGIYEFHAPHIRDAIEERLDAGSSVTMVVDPATFAGHGDDSIDAKAVFEDWNARFPFRAVVAPKGARGLMASSYHIKVTVDDADTFWLSSGNWKAGSSQPVITQAQRDEATEEDLPGNREWHVVGRNRKLASRFRNHLLQDYELSMQLGGRPFTADEEAAVYVDVPIDEETFVLERRAPSKVLPPLRVSGRAVKVRPLLTPDRQGAVYADTVLELIRSARTSLLFQIPYIKMPSSPRQHRGYIDELIAELAIKLKELKDARVLLRSGGSDWQKPTHVAWYFKSRGVDPGRIHTLENHHTKGMIVDGRRVLVGSHNWSQPGVSLNRDASLLFDDREIAGYYAQAFQVDWERSNPVKPARYVPRPRTEATVLEAVGDAPPPGYRRVRLADLLDDD